MDLTLSQQLVITIGDSPTSLNGPVTSKEVDLNETIRISNSDEIVSSRFKLEAGATDVELCFGTIDTAKCFYILAEGPLTFKLVNVNGTSQDINIVTNTPSILHCELTGVLVSNPDINNTVKGTYFVCGN